MRVLIGADFVPTESNNELFINKQTDEFLGKDLINLLNNAEYRIFNLEVPLADDLSPIEKCGPALIAPTATINGYSALSVDLFTLANNHILDQGINGLESTLKVLDKNKIAHVGVGNKDNAHKPYYFNFNGRKIGVYACAEHEFSIVGDFEKGANPFDPLETPDHIADLKKDCDYVIVLYHGGKEYYRYPSPNLQKVCRKMVDKGADLVVCQHSHCVGCEEKYAGGTIVYGQGNFLFDLSNNEFWQTSLLISLNEDYEIEYIPLAKKGKSVALADENQKASILSGFFERSEEIKKDGVIEEKYKEFAIEMLDHYKYAFSGIKHGFFSKVLNKLTKQKFLTWRIRKRLSKNKLLIIRNYIECEAHREIFIYGLKTNEK